MAEKDQGGAVVILEGITSKILTFLILGVVGATGYKVWLDPKNEAQDSDLSALREDVSSINTTLTHMKDERKEIKNQLDQILKEVRK